MKRLPQILLAIILAINIITGLILSCYPLFNMILNTVVICSAFLCYAWLNKQKIASAFATALAFIIPILTIVQIIIGIIAPPQIKDNFGIIAIVCIFALEIFLLFAISKCSDKSLK